MVGLVLSAASTGAVAAALTAAPLRRRFGFAACWIGSYLVSGLMAAVLGLFSQVAMVAMIAGGFAFGSSLATVCATSLRQERTPDHLLGRTTSAFAVVQSALGSAGTVVLTTTSAWAGVRTVSALAGAICAVVAACAVLTPITAADARRAG